MPSWKDAEPCSSGYYADFTAPFIKLSEELHRLYTKTEQEKYRELLKIGDKMKADNAEKNKS